MVYRLLALCAALTLSLSAHAKIDDSSGRIIRNLVTCDVTMAAKHMYFTLIVGIAAAGSNDAAEAIAPYEDKIQKAQTCPEYDEAYKLLAVAFKKVSGSDAEEFFNTPEGKKELNDLVTELEKIKSSL